MPDFNMNALVPTSNPLVYVRKSETPEAKAKRFDVMKKALAESKDGLPSGALAKASVSTGSNITWYDLRSPALHLVPFLSPIRDIMPRVQREKPGTAENWKVINGYNTGTPLASPWVNEGGRAPRISINASNKQAAYSTIGVDGSVTYEAQNASRGMEDADSLARFFALEALFVQEEDTIVGGNFSLALGQANTPVLTATGSGATLPTATYSVYAVGLTYEGLRNNQPSASTLPVALLPTTQSSTPDGKQQFVNLGVGNKSVNATQAITLGQNLGATVVQKAGEVAWAWYVGTLGNETLQAITRAPALTVSAPLVAGQQNASVITADCSRNYGQNTGYVTAYDGLLTTAFTAVASGNAYVKYLANATLTASGRGSVSEIDAAMQYAWDTYKVTYTAIYVNSQELLNITNKVLSNASGPLVRYNVDGSGKQYDITAAGTVGFYFNPFMPGGGRVIPIIVHPSIPAGTILMFAEELPQFFKTNNTPNVAEMLCRQDYYSVDWAKFTREVEFGVYSEQVLAVYAPFCIGVITGIKNG